MAETIAWGLYILVFASIMANADRLKMPDISPMKDLWLSTLCAFAWPIIAIGTVVVGIRGTLRRG